MERNRRLQRGPEASIRPVEKTPVGEPRAERSALFIATLNAVHAGGEPGWSSDHLEPFSF